MKREIIAQAEAAVKRRAAQIAFEHTQNVDDSDVQAVLFRLYKDYVILGARLMQEELLKIEYDVETEKEVN